MEKKEMKIALFETKYRSDSIIIMNDEGSCWADNDPDYVRVSDSLDVTFTMRPMDEVVPEQVKALETAKNTAHAEWIATAKYYDNKISMLMAITDQSEADQ